MRRRLFHLAVSFSLLLCVAAIAAWTASYWRAVEIGWRSTATRSWYLNCSAGKMFVVRRTGALTPGPRLPDVHERLTWLTYPPTPPLGPTNRDTHFSVLGFESHSRMAAANMALTAVVWPCWAVVL